MNTNLYTRHVMDLGTEKEPPGTALVACKQAMLDWARSHRKTRSTLQEIDDAEFLREHTCNVFHCDRRSLARAER